MLTNLGNLYAATQRPKEAESTFAESLTIFRQLAKDNPAAHLPDLAMTLDCFGLLYRDTQRPKEAEAMLSQASEIYRTLVLHSPRLYGDRLAESLRNLARLASVSDELRSCSLIREALQVVVSDDQRALASSTQEEVCKSQ